MRAPQGDTAPHLSPKLAGRPAPRAHRRPGSRGPTAASHISLLCFATFSRRPAPLLRIWMIKGCVQSRNVRLCPSRPSATCHFLPATNLPSPEPSAGNIPARSRRERDAAPTPGSQRPLVLAEGAARAWGEDKLNATWSWAVGGRLQEEASGPSAFSQPHFEDPWEPSGWSQGDNGPLSSS